MKLYDSKGTCSLVIRILLNELNVACDFEAVNLTTKVTETGADYLAINAKGSVPALWLAEHGLLTENVVIQQYLCDHYQAHDLLPPITHFKRYRVLEWLNFVSSELHKNLAPFFNPSVPLAINHTVFKPLFIKKLSLVEQHLTCQRYLTGDSFALADIYLFVVLTWLAHVDIALKDYPQLHAFFNEMKTRPSVVLALQQEARA